MTSQLKEELKIFDQRHFLYPTISIEQQPSQGSATIFTKGKGIYLKG
ncbi:hypothetical protein [Lysinibacillus sp. LZ02]